MAALRPRGWYLVETGRAASPSEPRSATILVVSSKGTRATDEARRAGVNFKLHEYEAEDGAGRRDHRPAYGQQAASRLGVDPDRIFKTLIASVDDRLVAAIVPVSAELDLKALAEAVGGRKATMADPAAAERATGYVVGGISPVGQRRRLRTVLDETARAFETIYVSAGRRGLQIELPPADLLRLTAGSTNPIARRA